jgi:hypothetical protein
MAALCAVYASYKDTPLKVAVVAVLAAALGLAVARPRPCFDEHGRPCCWGTRPGESLLPMWLALMLIGYTVYFFALAGTALACSAASDVPLPTPPLPPPAPANGA